MVVKCLIKPVNKHILQQAIYVRKGKVWSYNQNYLPASFVKAISPETFKHVFSISVQKHSFPKFISSSYFSVTFIKEPFHTFPLAPELDVCLLINIFSLSM